MSENYEDQDMDYQGPSQPNQVCIFICLFKINDSKFTCIFLELRLFAIEIWIIYGSLRA